MAIFGRHELKCSIPRGKKTKSIDRAENNNNNNRNNDNKWMGATVRPPRGIGGDLLRETRHRRRSEAGTTCKSEPPFPPVPPAGEIERNVHWTELETVGERAARERGWSPTESRREQGVSEEEEVRGIAARYRRANSRGEDGRTMRE